MNDIKTFDKQARQGDMLLTRIDALPDDVVNAKPDDDVYVCAHSETGHNHVMKTQGVQMFEAANDPLIAYLVVDNDVEGGAQLTHMRDFKTHDPIWVKNGIYRINRQRQSSPEGWVRAAD